MLTLTIIAWFFYLTNIFFLFLKSVMYTLKSPLDKKEVREFKVFVGVSGSTLFIVTAFVAAIGGSGSLLSNFLVALRSSSL